jgi:hypothetical protein
MRSEGFSLRIGLVSPESIFAFGSPTCPLYFRSISMEFFRRTDRELPLAFEDRRDDGQSVDGTRPLGLGINGPATNRLQGPPMWSGPAKLALSNASGRHPSYLEGSLRDSASSLAKTSSPTDYRSTAGWLYSSTTGHAQTRHTPLLILLRRRLRAILVRHRRIHLRLHPSIPQDIVEGRAIQPPSG